MIANPNCYDIHMSKKDDEETSITVSLSTLARMGQDALIILAVCSAFFGPLWYFNVQKPIADMSIRIDKLEASQDDVLQKLILIDKNVAVMLEKVIGLQQRQTKK